jgi:hypothetical protein
MSILDKLRTILKPRPKTPEDIAAEEEARRLHDDMLTARLSQESQAGQNYQSGRGTRQ